jgi:hypothetical protein
MRRMLQGGGRALALAGAFAMIVAAVVTGLPSWILLWTGVAILVFLYLTRNRISSKYVTGLKVRWTYLGEERSGVVLSAIQPGFLTVQEEPYGPETIPADGVRLALIDRLKYSWRRG